eukprot:scaffold706_cov418-Prasinococcus_capsulatus_cf.AAC.48
MSVHQTREHFMRKYGEIVDNQLVGRDLTEVYWSPGNGESFLSLVEKLTGSPLTADAWVAKLNTPVPALLKTEKQAYDEVYLALQSKEGGTTFDSCAFPCRTGDQEGHSSD